MTRKVTVRTHGIRHFQAVFDGCTQPHTGETITDAIGHLVLQAPGAFGIELVIEEKALQRAGCFVPPANETMPPD